MVLTDQDTSSEVEQLECSVDPLSAESTVWTLYPFFVVPLHLHKLFGNNWENNRRHIQECGNTIIGESLGIKM